MCSCSQGVVVVVVVVVVVAAAAATAAAAAVVVIVVVTATTSVLTKYPHISESFKQWLVHNNTTSIIKHKKGLWKMQCTC